MTLQRWVFTDPVDSTTYTFEVNPNDGGSPARKKNVTGQPTTAEDGTPIIFEGQNPLSTSQFSGTVLSQAQYQAMELWFKKRHPINYTDDLGRTFTIYITAFTPKRGGKQSHPWRHTYDVDYLITAEA